MVDIINKLKDFAEEEYGPYEYSDEEKKYFEISQRSWLDSQRFFDIYRAKVIIREDMYNSRHSAILKDYCNPDYKRSKHYISKPHEHVKTGVAQIAQAYGMNPQICTVAPEIGNDMLNCASAEFFQAYLDIELRGASDEFSYFVQAVGKDSLIHNFVVGKVDYDTEKKTPVMMTIPIEKFRIDPRTCPINATEHSPYMIHVKEMYVYEIIEKQKKYGWKNFTRSDISKSLVEGPQSIHQVEDARKFEGIDQTRLFNTVDLYNKVYVHENFVKDEKGNFKVFHTLSDCKLLTDIYDLEEQYPYGNPFRVASVYPENTAVYPSAPFDHAFQTMCQINEMFNVAMDMIKKNAYPLTLFRPNSGIKINQLKNQGFDLYYEARNPTDDLFQFQHQYDPTSLLNQLPILYSNFDSIVGSFSHMSSATSGSNATTATEQSFQYTQQSQISEMYLRNLNTFIENMIELFTECGKAYVGSNKELVEKIFAELDLDQRYKALGYKGTLKVNKEFLSQEFEIKTNVGIGSVNPVLRSEKLIASIMTLRNLEEGIVSTLNVKEIARELFNSNGLANIDRFFKKSEDPRIIQLQNQISQMQQELILAKKKTPEEIASEIRERDAKTQVLLAGLDNVLSTKNNLDAKTKLTNVQTLKESMETSLIMNTAPEVIPAAEEIAKISGVQDPTPEDPLFTPIVPEQPGIQNELDDKVVMMDTKPVLKTQQTGF